MIRNIYIIRMKKIRKILTSALFLFLFIIADGDRARSDVSSVLLSDSDKVKIVMKKVCDTYGDINRFGDIIEYNIIDTTSLSVDNMSRSIEVINNLFSMSGIEFSKRGYIETFPSSSILLVIVPHQLSDVDSEKINFYKHMISSFYRYVAPDMAKTMDSIEHVLSVVYNKYPNLASIRARNGTFIRSALIFIRAAPNADDMPTLLAANLTAVLGYNSEYFLFPGSGISSLKSGIKAEPSNLDVEYLKNLYKLKYNDKSSVCR